MKYLELITYVISALVWNWITSIWFLAKMEVSERKLWNQIFLITTLLTICLYAMSIYSGEKWRVWNSVISCTPLMIIALIKYRLNENHG